MSTCAAHRSTDTITQSVQRARMRPRAASAAAAPIGTERRSSACQARVRKRPGQCRSHRQSITTFAVASRWLGIVGIRLLAQFEVWQDRRPSTVVAAGGQRRTGTAVAAMADDERCAPRALHVLVRVLTYAWCVVTKLLSWVASSHDVSLQLRQRGRHSGIDNLCRNSCHLVGGAS